MSLAVEKHLEGITVENFIEYKLEQFTVYASARGVKLGWTGKGKYAVQTGRKVITSHIYDNPNDAIEKYKELVRQ